MQLEDDVRAILAGRPGNFGIYARNLGTGETVEIDADRVLPTESAAKTFMLVHYSALVTEGTLDSGSTHHAHPRATSTTLGPRQRATTWCSKSAGYARDHGAIDSTAHAALLPAATRPSDATTHDLAEVYTHLDERCRDKLFRQQFVDFSRAAFRTRTNRSTSTSSCPSACSTRPADGLGTCIDSGRFETDTAAWIVAAKATDQQDFASRADDSAPGAFADIGELLYQRWGT